ncbi:glucose-1-phosphate thymidylyltransferase RfbA [Balneolaceae bacterium ANBcel3]|nr:glucose-1-phosphate thymidylyltransferase RfbA [Balneolaceae bacterium ANBcel3]
MKGIILAGGSGTRLYPLTRAVSKQLIPVYDKPMIYYPLSVLMLAGIRDILIITTPEDQEGFKRLLGKGSDWGIRLSYEVQPRPEGIAQAFLIGESFIGKDPVALILGDNIFYGQGFRERLLQSVKTLHEQGGAMVFGYPVNDPHRYGIAEMDADNNVLSVEEKPEKPKSNIAVTGLYFYDNKVLEYARQITPSKRGELEITAINQRYLEKGRLLVNILGRGFAWLDTGTHEAMLQAAQFVEIIESRQGLKIACLEEIAWRNQWIDKEQVLKEAEVLGKTGYGAYLKRIIGQA